MAAGKFKLYEQAKKNLANGLIDLDSHTFKAALFLSSSNCDTLSVNELLADLTNEHASANGYARVTLTNVAWTNSGGTMTFDADIPAWTASGGSIVARFVVIYDDTATGDPLLCVALLDAAPADVMATDGNTLTVTVNASGLFTLSGAASN